MLEYLKKSGGDMTGALRANYGFEAGVANNRILEICSQDITDADGAVTAVEYGVKITGSLKIGGSSLHIGGQQLLGYDTDRNTATLNASRIVFRMPPYTRRRMDYRERKRECSFLRHG